jgi:hypothetical protein
MILSDEPTWQARAQYRRQFCLPTSPSTIVVECGWPHKMSELGNLLAPSLSQEIWTRSQKASNDYLRATGLARNPACVYGQGPRAVWADDPGRWFVAHIANPELLNVARTHFAGAGPTPTEPKVAHTHLNGLATQIVKRNEGEPAATQGDVLKAAILMLGLDPSLSFAAGPNGRPMMERIGESNSIATIDDSGLLLGTPAEKAGWHDAFRQRQPHFIPPNADTPSAAGPIRVERFKWSALFARAQAGDRSVPQSPIELGVSFAETAGIDPHECWGISERLPGTKPESAIAQVVYRPRPDHDNGGRARFFAYLAALGITASDVDVGHPEGYIAMAWGGATMIKPYPGS